MDENKDPINEDKDRKLKIWLAAAATAFGLLASCLGPVLFLQFLQKSGATDTPANPVGTLAVLAFAGLVGLLAFLALMAFIFGTLGLASKEEALGLPEGSIRAVIALSLIVIFILSSLFLFGRLGERQVVTIEGLTAEQAAQIPGGQIMSQKLVPGKSAIPEKAAVAAKPGANGEPGTPAVPAQPGQPAIPPTYIVTRQIEPTRASEDFGKQLLTTIGTLVVAVASFYFGSKAVASGQSAVNDFIKTHTQPEGQPEKPQNGGNGSGEKPVNNGKPEEQNEENEVPENQNEPDEDETVIDAPKPTVLPDAQLAEFISKRAHPTDLPESSGFLTHDASGKLELATSKAGMALALKATAPAAVIGEDHWLSTAVRRPIGTGKVFTPTFVVIHYTEGYAASTSIEDWRNRTDNVLAHVIVDRDGTIYQCRPFNQICFHAGESRTRHPQTDEKVEGLNQVSIGIEIANLGDGGEHHLLNVAKKHLPDLELHDGPHRNDGVKDANATRWKSQKWEEYRKPQLESVFMLVSLLVAKYGLADITGHDCISFERKSDPGPAFPMEELRKANNLAGLPVVYDAKCNKIKV